MGNGAMGPLSVRAVPLRFICDIVSSDPPVLLIVTDCVAVVFTRMLPKDIGLGDTAIWAGVGAGVPEPLRETTAGEFVALLTKDADPVTFPLIDGPKRMVTSWVCPAGINTGNVGAITLKPAPVALPAETVTAEFPVFVRVTFCVELVPTTMLPNESVPGETLRL